MPVYPFTRETPINPPKLQSEINALGAQFDGFSQAGTTIYVIAKSDLAAQQINAAGSVVFNHDAALTSGQQENFNGLTQLSAFLTGHVDDFKYADYFYRLQKRLLDLWRTRPNLTDTTTEVYAALRANKDTDANHATMYTVFLWQVQRTASIALSAGDLPASPTAAQAAAIIQAAYIFMNSGVSMANMILMNQRGLI